MNRRHLLAGLAATLILPPTLAENVEATRRYWALDQTHLSEEQEWRDWQSRTRKLVEAVEQMGPNDGRYTTWVVRTIGASDGERRTITLPSDWPMEPRPVIYWDGDILLRPIATSR